VLLAVLVVAAAVVVAIVLLADRAERGTGQPRGAPPKQAEAHGLKQVSLAQDGVRDFDPQGDGKEHPEAVRFILDRDPNTTWMTETYQNGVFPPDKTGVGLYVDAKPSAAGRQMEIRTPTAGWQGQIYVAASGPPAELSGWKAVADFTMTRTRQSISLDTAGQRFRYYLIWITKLPPGQEKVEISEVQLFQ
jgi:serine/threonine-protein kinase